MTKDYYKILGVDKKCTDDKIKKSYRKLAMLWHPDKHVNDSEKDKKIAEDKFKEINNAYEILGNVEKRRQYDQFGDNVFTNNNNSNNGYKFNDASNIFNTFFDNGFDFNHGTFPNYGQKIHINLGGNRQNNGYTRVPVKDKTVFIDLPITLEDLYTGIIKKMKISRKKHINNTIITESEILSIDIKPGWKEGTKITFNNKGDVNIGSEPADIVFVIKYKPHSLFTRQDNNLIT